MKDKNSRLEVKAAHLPATSKLKSSVGLMVAATVASGCLNYVYTLVLTRLLPTRSYSAFSSSLAILLVVGTVANAAVPWILARELREESTEIDGRRYISAGFVLNIILGMIAAGFCMLLARGFLDLEALAALAAGAFTFFVASTGMGWALGRARYRLLAVMVAGEVGIKVAIGTIWVENGGGMVAAIGAATLGSTAVIILSVLTMSSDRRLVRPGPHFGRVLKAGAVMSLVQGLLVAAAVLDVFLVEVVLPASSRVSTYQLAATLGRAPIFLAMALSAIVFPTISSKQSDRKKDSTRISEGLSMLLVMVLPAWAILATTPRSIILVIAPSTYKNALQFLPITAASGLLWTVVILLSCCLVAARQGRTVSISIIICGAVGGIAMTFAGPAYGVWGFAICELLTALVTLVVVSIASWRQWGQNYVNGAMKKLPWLLPVLPLALLRGLPVLWATCASLTGLLCLATSFPIFIPKKFQR